MMFSYDSSKNEFLTKEEIQKIAPSVFTETANPNTTSKHYVHIPTERVIDDMKALGWGVVDAKQVKARKGVGYQQHMVVFGNDDLVINGADGDTVMPRVLMTNSHDGKNSFQFQAGLYRLVCSNGLVISDAEFANLKIRHMGYDLSELKNVIEEIVEKLPLTVECMNRLKQTKLNQEQAEKFALEAIGLRFGEEVNVGDNTGERNTSGITLDVSQVLESTRPEDEGDDLWSIFNVIQEKLVHGMINYRSNGKVRKARKIKNFKQDTKINQDLYKLALEYAA